MVILNGHILTGEEAKNNCWNRSFRYGDGLFETVRVYQGEVIFLHDHLDRLREGMAVLGMQVAWRTWAAEITSSVSNLVNAQELAGPGRLRLHVWRSGGGTYTPEEDQVEYLVEYRPIDREYFHEVIPASCSDFHGATVYPDSLSRIKTASALPYVLAARQARDSGTDEALLFNHRKEIAEASAANLFLFKKKKLLTPPLKSGCVNGLMRKRVLEIAGMLQMEVEERPVKRRDLTSADSAFLTNSIRGIQPISSYQHRTWTKNNWRHVQLLQKSLLDLVKSEIST